MVISSTASDAYTVREESFESLSSYPLTLAQPLAMNCPFVLPAWMKVWWETFGAGQECCLLGVRDRESLIGVAPLKVRGAEASFIGAPEVCDYLDFITAPGRGPEFFRLLIRELRRRSVSILELAPVRADSSVMKELIPQAKRMGGEALLERENVSYELTLPATWEDYLGRLKGTERHEIRRKLKRLNEAGRTEFRTVNNSRQELGHAIDTFLRLFESNRPDKADFLTSQRASFFRAVAEAMAEAGLLKLSILELDARPAAAVMCFHDPTTVYLYNNGYDNRFRSLSVGMLSKVLSIREALQEGKKRFDFLKGPEAYKRRLGGKPVPLYRCRVLIG